MECEKQEMTSVAQSTQPCAAPWMSAGQGKASASRLRVVNFKTGSNQGKVG